MGRVIRISWSAMEGKQKDSRGSVSAERPGEAVYLRRVSKQLIEVLEWFTAIKDKYYSAEANLYLVEYYLDSQRPQLPVALRVLR